MKRFKILMIALFAGLLLTGCGNPNTAEAKNIYIFQADSNGNTMVTANGQNEYVDGAQITAISTTARTVTLSFVNSQGVFTIPFYIGTDSTNPRFTTTKQLSAYLAVFFKFGTGFQTYNHQNTAANTDSTLVKTGLTRLVYLSITNAGANTEYVKIYDTAGCSKRSTATGTTTVKWHLYAIGPKTTTIFGVGPKGILFKNGLTYRDVGQTGYFVNETGHAAATEVPAAGDITIDIGYN